MNTPHNSDEELDEILVQFANEHSIALGISSAGNITEAQNKAQESQEKAKQALKAREERLVRERVEELIVNADTLYTNELDRKLWNVFKKELLK